MVWLVIPNGLCLAISLENIYKALSNRDLNKKEDFGGLPFVPNTPRIKSNVIFCDR